MASAEMIEKLATRATAAEQMIEILIKQIEEIKANQGKGDYAQEIKLLRSENARLKSEVQAAKDNLVKAEKAAGISQVDVQSPVDVLETKQSEPIKDNAKDASPAPAPKKEKAKKEKKEPEKKVEGGDAAAVDIGR